MPTISRFHGILITMFFNEGFHPGRPHFHAEYAEASASYSVTDLEKLNGSLPPRVERLVKSWARAHREELIINWERARAHKPLHQIDPLKN